jgi:hypothetical protein
MPTDQNDDDEEQAFIKMKTNPYLRKILQILFRQGYAPANQ